MFVSKTLNLIKTLPKLSISLAQVLQLHHFIISATEAGMCGYIERDEKLASYCFCYGDYCNTASVINYTVYTTLWLIFSSLVTLRAVLDS